MALFLKKIYKYYLLFLTFLNILNSVDYIFLGMEFSWEIKINSMRSEGGHEGQGLPKSKIDVMYIAVCNIDQIPCPFISLFDS